MSSESAEDVWVKQKVRPLMRLKNQSGVPVERKIHKSNYEKNIFSTSVNSGVNTPNALADTIFMFGERGSGMKCKGKPQDFYKIRDKNLANGTLFEDPQFPAEDSSLYFSKTPDRKFEWKRPFEIVKNPQLFVEGHSRFDVQQGELGDCWLLAGVANLTLYPKLFFQIVPVDQDFGTNYAGIFHFRFWQYGRWIDVVIDDRLPTYCGQLIFLHSSERNEFWSALFEKAYAKLHGSYEALDGGRLCESMEDFTGGVAEMFELTDSPPNLFRIMLKAYERSSLMGCSIDADPDIVEAQTPEGLIKGHAYSITKVQYVDIVTPRVRGKIPLLRLRNPWGNESEWNGQFSDGSQEWRVIPDSEKMKLGLTFDNDGEFWMTFKDFQNNFTRMEICNLNPGCLSKEELLEGNRKKWEMSIFEGEWVKGVTAGGCRKYLDSFWHNPQYRITLTEVDEEEDDGKCTLIVALMQKNRRQLRTTGADNCTIGFVIYHIPNQDEVPIPLDRNFFAKNRIIERSQYYIPMREIVGRFKLLPGTYCIVPSTFDPNEEAEFLLRVFSEHQNNMKENDQQIGYNEENIEMIIEEKTPAYTREHDPMFKYFKALAGEDEEIDWLELKNILDYYMNNETNYEGFSKNVCRSMIAMLDVDRSGNLGYEEFRTLWSMIAHWRGVWTTYDKDNSGSLSGFELREALNSAGYYLNSRILNVLMHRYGNKSGEIFFEDFIMCAIKLKTMIDIFKAYDKTTNDTATFSMDEWIECTLYS